MTRKKIFNYVARSAMTLFLAVTGITNASAKVDFLGHSAINVNGTWYYTDDENHSWCTGGNFNGATLGTFTSYLPLAGQSQTWEEGNKDWNSGTVTMYYKFDDGAAQSIGLDYYQFANNNNYFQSGGSNFALQNIDISQLTPGNHTISVWFNCGDKWDSNNGDNYVATFTISSGPVSYLDANGNTLQETATLLTGNETSLSEGWYVVVNQGTTIDYMELEGTFNLILADGADVTITNGINLDGYLNIYAQSTGSNQGSLITSRIYYLSWYAYLTINGGTINANGYGISASHVTINGGSISATNTDDYDSRGIEANHLTINGGSVNASGKNYGIYAGEDFTLNGGEVNTTGKYGIYAANGNITITNSSVSAIGQEASGIYAHDVTIEDSEINATGSDSGISAYKYIIINGGSINATGSIGLSGDNITIIDGSVSAIGQGDYGICADYITIEDGDIYATASEDGIHANYNITINGGSVTIISQEGGDYPEAGIFADGVITLNGGTVISTGTDYGIGYGTIILAGATVTASSYSAAIVAIANDIQYSDGTNTSATFTDLNATKTLYAIMPETYTLTAKQAPDGNYWSTFYFGSLGFKIDEGDNACAYTAYYNNNTLTLYKLGKVIPKGTAVVIVAGGNGSDKEVNLTLSRSDAAAEFTPEYANNLHGVDVRTDKSTLGSGTFYVMGQTDEGFGFHPYSGAYMPARKAFLRIDGGAALARMVFEDATGIKSIDNGLRTIDNESDAWYSLDGRKLSQKPKTKGVYINNGKKIVIK